MDRRSSAFASDTFETVLDFAAKRMRAKNCVSRLSTVSGGSPLKNASSENTQSLIVVSLREVMNRIEDLDMATTSQIRNALNSKIGIKITLGNDRFIRDQIAIIYGEMAKASLILPSLYLGSHYNACNLFELTENEIERVVTVSVEKPYHYPGIKYMHVMVEDEEDVNLLDYFHNTFKFIDEARNEGLGVLVHCHRGISRSASVITAYLMRKNLWTLQTSLDHVCKQRQAVQPNPGFMRQLHTYGQR